MTSKIISYCTILVKLGEGDMRVVYKAESTELRPTIALKSLLAEIAA